MFERLTIVGNLGNDPEMKYTPNGDAVTNFSVAVDQSYTNREGQKVERAPKWFRVACWRKLAETTNEYLSKGRQVMVEGIVSASHYVDNQGETRVSLEVTAFTVKFLGGGGQANGNGAPAGTGGVPDDDEDDLPW